ncbi:intradiol ring-cleavage dioxygenase [Dactylosporangium sp. NPDC048998]|uniref:intradiol ring-cleavage dioxygenase n=1 Tax=Dactylosporangium sp. NPDC048998 TaxID=3363976 RepID=UPI003716004B
MPADDHEGQRVSRRTLVRGISALSFGGLLAACSGGDRAAPTGGATPAASTTTDLTGLFAGANTCTMSPNVTQGPYYFDADKIRSDIREDRQGTRLRVVLKVQESASCRPLHNAVVEIWHCDAAGLYSGAESMSAGGNGGPAGGNGGPMPGGAPPSGMPGGAPGNGGGDQPAMDLKPADDKRYLRGAQVSNADGIVEFTTIWPGWYRGRTVHIHVMLHVNDKRVLISQLMFDESLNAKVFTAEPYAKHTGRDTTNDNDTIYQPSMLMKVTEDDDGYLGVIALSA